MYFDISPILSENTAVFPGDTPFKRTVLMSFAQGHHLDLSRIESTVHIGAHADAPSHYGAKGATIEKRSLDYYLGECQVVEVKVAPGARIQLKDFSIDKVKAPRVLFKTNSFNDPNMWVNEFNSLSPEVIRALKAKGVMLVGIDTPSVDPWDSKDLETHTEIFKSDMAILEGLVLSKVPEGIYKLIALPLSIQDGDASPVRAILVSPQDWARL